MLLNCLIITCTVDFELFLNNRKRTHKYEPNWEWHDIRFKHPDSNDAVLTHLCPQFWSSLPRRRRLEDSHPTLSPPTYVYKPRLSDLHILMCQSSTLTWPCSEDHVGLVPGSPGQVDHTLCLLSKKHLWSYTMIFPLKWTPFFKSPALCFWTPMLSIKDIRYDIPRYLTQLYFKTVCGERVYLNFALTLVRSSIRIQSKSKLHIMTIQ